MSDSDGPRLASSRRRFVLQLCAGGVMLGCGRAGAPRASRPDVLRSVVTQLMIPDVVLMVRRARELCDAIAQGHPQARRALPPALLAFERGYTVRMGPLIDSHALIRSTFFPPRVASLRTLLEDGGLAPAEVEALGVGARGLFAIEALLFGAGEAHEELAAHPRALAVAGALAADVRAYAERAERELGDGAALARQLIASEQSTMSQLVNDMLASVEALTSERVGLLLAMREAGRIRLADVRGAPSASSTALVVAHLGGLADLYARMAPLIAGAAPALQEHLAERFRGAQASVVAIGAPLERAVNERVEALEAAVAALRALELAIKLELASALGTTLTFTSSDGD